MATSSKRDTAVQRVLKCFAERKDGHSTLCAQFERSERAYHAQVDVDSKAAQWRSQLFPPYAMQVADTVVANLVDDRTRFAVRPRPKMSDPADIEKHIQGARAHELLLSFQMDLDRYNRKKAFYVQQCVKKGLTVGKNFWLAEKRLVRSLETRPTYDDLGQQIGWEEVESDKEEVARDDPSFEPVRVEDFMWEEGAIELQRSPWLIHRVPATMDELRALEREGVYKNVGDLGQDSGERSESSFADEFTRLDEELFNERRYKNRVELLEYWTREDGALRCITVANRRVLLADRRHLFAHGQYPFVCCSTRPNEFRIPGRSIIEAIRDLQHYLWTVDNQTLDNIMLTNNFIVAYRDDLLDDSDLEIYPGAKWSLQTDVRESIQQFVPDTSIVQMALLAAARIKEDLQSITSGMPFVGGTDSGTQQTTATGVSIVTSLAQRMLASQKQWLAWSEEETANQWVALNQQFKRTETLVPVIGMDGATAFEAIGPDVLSGSYHVNVDPVPESLVRQERIAQAQAQLTMFLQAAPVYAAMGAPLNPRAFMDNYLRAYDIDNLESYYSAQPQAPPVGPGGPQQPGQGGQPGQNGGLGITSPLAYGPQGPNSPQSLSGEQHVQRLMSMMGGSNNAG